METIQYPILKYNDNGDLIYYENNLGKWVKFYYDENRELTHCTNSDNKTIKFWRNDWRVADVVNKISAYSMLGDSLLLSKNCGYYNSNECDCMDGFCHYGEKR